MTYFEAWQQYDEIRARLMESCAAFHPICPGRTVIFNCAPKSGTHLLRNVMMHMCGVAGVKEEFVWSDNVADVAAGLTSPTLLFGHIPYIDHVFDKVSSYRMVLLCKSPVDHVLSLAKSIFDSRVQRSDQIWMRNNLTVEEVIEHVVRGYEIEGVRIGSYSDMFSDFVCRWVPHAALILQMDQLIPFQPTILARIADLASFVLPADWEYRVERGSRQEISATYMPTFDPGKINTYRHVTLRLLEQLAPSAIDCYNGIRFC